jgi:hypothetical protein
MELAVGLLVMVALGALLLALWYYSRRSQDYRVEDVAPDGEELIVGERLERPESRPARRHAGHSARPRTRRGRAARRAVAAPRTAENWVNFHKTPLSSAPSGATMQPVDGG